AARNRLELRVGQPETVSHRTRVDGDATTLATFQMRTAFGTAPARELADVSALFLFLGEAHRIEQLAVARREVDVLLGSLLEPELPDESIFTSSIHRGSIVARWIPRATGRIRSSAATLRVGAIASRRDAVLCAKAPDEVREVVEPDVERDLGD